MCLAFPSICPLLEERSCFYLSLASNDHISLAQRMNHCDTSQSIVDLIKVLAMENNASKHYK